jgi:2,3-dihydroxy-2,3-dihydro-p-cumate dehydrogenase
MVEDVRVAIVTGAAQGIGLGIVERLLRDGLRIVASDVDGDRMAENVSGLGGDVRTYVGDLSDPARAVELIKAAIDAHGRLDVLVNNAGGGVIRPFLDHDEASIAETLSRNLLTTINCCRAAIPAMRVRGGRIVNLGAESVRNGLLAHAMYNAAKGGVHGLSSGLAREFAADGITVNAVAPSIVQTPAIDAAMAAPDQLPPELRAVLDQSIGLIPMGRPAAIAEVADTVAFLASDAAGFITGQVISVNGGSSMQ